MTKEILRLFKGYLGEKSENVVEEGLKYGLLIPNTANDDIVKEAIEMYGKDGSKWNQTFHKDFEIVRNAPIEDLIAQQIIHYITTYGFESLGMYDSDLVYIPNEKLEIPELDIENIELITIRPLTNEELTEKLMILLTSGIALSEQTIKDVMVLSDYIDKDRFDEIKNKEIKTALYEKYNIMPKNPDEFLRYLIFKTTGSTLKIQNREMVERIKECDKRLAFNMMITYVGSNGMNKLSTIFLRNKDLFLAYKIKKNDDYFNNILAKDMNKLINRLRKLAVKYHKPLKKNILDCLTDENQEIDLTQLLKELDEITIFRELRILNGIKYRLEGSNSIVHKIRNGKSYVRTLGNKSSTYDERVGMVYECVYSHLIERLKNKVKGKTICIPKSIEYAVPTTEKMFSGNIPDGSYIEVPRTDNMVYGVYWKNIANGKSKSSFYGEETRKGEERVDLDLKQMNKSEVFGWDASYRSDNSDILFSGDMTDAQLPNGASELFYVGRNYGYGAFLITLNNFTNSRNRTDIPFEFVIAKATHKPQQRVYYALDPNNILEKLDMVIKQDEGTKIVGFITIGDTIRFYFNDFSAGANVRTSSRNEITMGAFDYLQSYSKTQLKLKDVLKDAGAIITDKELLEKTIVKEVRDENGNLVKVHEEVIEVPVDIDLSLNAITKETIIEILS